MPSLSETPSNEGLWRFLMQHKAWWLTPIVVIVLGLALLLLLTDSTELAPFVYTVF